jgi:hypothetical protein
MINLFDIIFMKNKEIYELKNILKEKEDKIQEIEELINISTIESDYYRKQRDEAYLSLSQIRNITEGY